MSFFSLRVSLHCVRSAIQWYIGGQDIGHRTKKLELVLLRRRRRVFGTFFRPPCLPPTANEREEREGAAEEESAFAEPLPSPPHTLHTYTHPPSARGSGAKKRESWRVSKSFPRSDRPRPRRTNEEEEEEEAVCRLFSCVPRLTPSSSPAAADTPPPAPRVCSLAELGPRRKRPWKRANALRPLFPPSSPQDDGDESKKRESTTHHSRCCVSRRRRRRPHPRGKNGVEESGGRGFFE